MWNIRQFLEIHSTHAPIPTYYLDFLYLCSQITLNSWFDTYVSQQSIHYIPVSKIIFLNIELATSKKSSEYSQKVPQKKIFSQDIFQQQQ